MHEWQCVQMCVWEWRKSGQRNVPPILYKGEKQIFYNYSINQSQEIKKTHKNMIPLEIIVIIRHLRFDRLHINENIDCEK